MRDRVGALTMLSVMGLAAAPLRASAQTLAPTPPAVCVTPATPAVPNAADTANITGVVVRFTTSATGRATDAHLAKALSTRTAEQLQALVATPVRARYDVTMAPGKSDASSAVAEGRVLGVRWVVAGRAERTDDSISVSWNVLDARTGVQRGTGTTRDALVHLDAMSSRLSLAIGRKIGYTGTALAQANGAPVSHSVAAFEQYLAGLFEYDSFSPEAQRRAVAALRGAVKAEPALQPAWTALAETLSRLVEWGEGGSALGRSVRSRDALAAANRALALAPRDAHTLALMAHVHLLRDEPIAGAQAIEGVRTVAPNSDDLPWLAAELALVRGDVGALAVAIDSGGAGITRNAHALFMRAEWERRRGKMPAACQALNRLLVLEPSWAPAYVQRALVRTALGDRRGGWQDAEMATRLGQPTWGAMASALIDFSVSDSLRTRAQLRRVAAIHSGTVLPWLDVLLQSAVWHATGQGERALRVLAVVPCDDPRRRLFADDPLLRYLKVPANCRVSAGLSQPADELTQ